MSLFLSICCALGVIALLVRAARQRQFLARLPLGTASGPLPAASVILPVRNEHDNIARCLAALCAQDYPKDRLAIFVVDDESSDDTGTIASGISASDGRVSILSAGPLPAGWMGKPHACAIGAEAAGTRAQWLCFLDADVHLTPRALADAVAHAEIAGLDMLCLVPRQELGSLVERLIIPCGLYALAFTRHLEHQSSGAPPVTGQFMLVRRSVYAKIGGHAAVAHEVAEDLALARQFAQAGRKVCLMGAEHVASVRMYRNGHDLWEGFAKNLVALFGGSAQTIRVAVAAMTLSWAAVLLPVGEWAFRSQTSGPALWALGVAIGAALAVFAFHIAGAVALRIPAWYGLLFPVGYTLGAVLAFYSVKRNLEGSVRWKGRTYP